MKSRQNMKPAISISIKVDGDGATLSAENGN